MDGSQQQQQPAPFLLKTYEMVDNSSTDSVVSWSHSGRSFIVWNPPEFCRDLLPQYFKHNNFSSFIRQLNTYGFRKIDPEQWEFANDEFIKGHRHLLKNIYRRKFSLSFYLNLNASKLKHISSSHQHLPHFHIYRNNPSKPTSQLTQSSHLSKFINHPSVKISSIYLDLESQQI